MHLTFLGTSAGLPSRSRNVTSIALTLDSGRVWLFDCGESTQNQIMLSNIKSSHIDCIFISHMHGDHWLGLPGLLATMKMQRRETPLEIIGPAEVESILKSIHQLTGSSFGFPVTFVNTREHNLKLEREGFKIVPRMIEHSVFCCGFLLTAKDSKGRFKIEKLKAAGLDTVENIKRLSNGIDINSDGHIVSAADYREPDRKGIKILILGDTSNPEVFLTETMGLDWLIHECTYDDGLGEKALEVKHSTAGMAGQFASRINAKNLILTHFSPRYESPESLEMLKLQAKKQSPDTEVWLAHDFLDIYL